MVKMESIVSGHQRNFIRDRLADKAEFIYWDPWGEF